MSALTRFRCQCGYEALEQPRPGYHLVAVYHLHEGVRGWGPIAVRMEPIELPARTKVPAEREMATVA